MIINGFSIWNSKLIVVEVLHLDPAAREDAAAGVNVGELWGGVRANEPVAAEKPSDASGSVDVIGDAPAKQLLGKGLAEVVAVVGDEVIVTRKLRLELADGPLDAPGLDLAQHQGLSEAGSVDLGLDFANARLAVLHVCEGVLPALHLYPRVVEPEAQHPDVRVYAVQVVNVQSHLYHYDPGPGCSPRTQQLGFLPL